MDSTYYAIIKKKSSQKSALDLDGVNLKRLMNGTFVWEGSQGSCYPGAARHQGFPGFQGRNRWRLGKVRNSAQLLVTTLTQWSGRGSQKCSVGPCDSEGGGKDKMVNVLSFGFLLYAVFHFPAAFTLPLGNNDGRTGDLTEAMVRKN